jgi:excisionase family DNA binding protein
MLRPANESGVAEALRHTLAETVTQPEAAQSLGISLPALRARVWRGSIPCVRVGRAVLIPRSAIASVSPHGETA